MRGRLTAQLHDYPGTWPAAEAAAFARLLVRFTEELTTLLPGSGRSVIARLLTAGKIYCVKIAQDNGISCERARCLRRRRSACCPIWRTHGTS
jgi:hypothetical protein